MGPSLRRLTVSALLLAALAAASCGGSDPGAAQGRPPVAASASGGQCGAAIRQPDQGRQHLTDLNHAFSQHPATAGPHDPVPLPPSPAVYTEPVPEARAVHNLEHGYVWVYYQPSGSDALPAELVAALTAAAPGERKVLMAPYPRLPAGAALDFAAWDELQQCGAGVTAEEALATFRAFVATFREGALAPEPAAR